jgi:hypothetical protein
MAAPGVPVITHALAALRSGRADPGFPARIAEWRAGGCQGPAPEPFSSEHGCAPMPAADTVLPCLPARPRDGNADMCDEAHAGPQPTETVLRALAASTAPQHPLRYVIDRALYTFAAHNSTAVPHAYLPLPPGCLQALEQQLHRVLAGALPAWAPLQDRYPAWTPEGVAHLVDEVLDNPAHCLVQDSASEAGQQPPVLMPLAAAMPSLGVRADSTPIAPIPLLPRPQPAPSSPSPPSSGAPLLLRLPLQQPALAAPAPALPGHDSQSVVARAPDSDAEWEAAADAPVAAVWSCIPPVAASPAVADADADADAQPDLDVAAILAFDPLALPQPAAERAWAASWDAQAETLSETVCRAWAHEDVSVADDPWWRAAFWSLYGAGEAGADEGEAKTPSKVAVGADAAGTVEPAQEHELLRGVVEPERRREAEEGLAALRARFRTREEALQADAEALRAAAADEEEAELPLLRVRGRGDVGALLQRLSEFTAAESEASGVHFRPQAKTDKGSQAHEEEEEEEEEEVDSSSAAAPADPMAVPKEFSGDAELEQLWRLVARFGLQTDEALDATGRGTRAAKVSDEDDEDEEEDFEEDAEDDVAAMAAFDDQFGICLRDYLPPSSTADADAARARPRYSLDSDSDADVTGSGPDSDDEPDWAEERAPGTGPSPPAAVPAEAGRHAEQLRLLEEARRTRRLGPVPARKSSKKAAAAVAQPDAQATASVRVSFADEQEEKSDDADADAPAADGEDSAGAADASVGDYMWLMDRELRGALAASRDATRAASSVSDADDADDVLLDGHSATAGAAVRALLQAHEDEQAAGGGPVTGLFRAMGVQLEAEPGFARRLLEDSDDEGPGDDDMLI